MGKETFLIFLGIIVLINFPDWLRIMFISLIGLILLIYILTRIYDFILKNNESSKSKFWKLIACFRLTLLYIAPVLIVFYFYSMAQDPSDDGFGALMFFISFFVSIYYYLNLFEKKTGNDTDSSFEYDDKGFIVFQYFREYSSFVFWALICCILSFFVFLMVVRFG